LVHEIRGLLHEYSTILPQGITTCRTLVVKTLEAEHAQLTPFSIETFWPLYAEFLALENGWRLMTRS
jgi:hypothetical protein